MISMIPLSTHLDYLTHLAAQVTLRLDDALFMSRLARYGSQFFTLLCLSLDEVRERLAALYCPTGQGDPRDPIGMLRSWLLMTLLKEHSPDAWVTRLRNESVLAMLAGFAPDDTPGASTHRDFLARYADGPYDSRKTQDVTLSASLTGRHSRRLDDATEARRAEAGPHNTQSAALVDRLLEEADQPRDPNALETRLQDLLADLGLRPSLDAGLLDDPFHLRLNGDGTILETAASPEGDKTCDCDPRDPDCDHPREYTSPTAQWCKDTHHRAWVFGDRSYTISIHVNGHDLPLITIMGTGNESDFTLGPNALDALLKLLEEHDLPCCPVIFTGDGHHDCQAMYLYLKDKHLIPIIPLRDSSTTDKDLKKHPIPAKKTAAADPKPAAESDPKPAAESDPKPAAESDLKPAAESDPKPDTPKKTKTKRTPRPQVDAYPHILFEPDGTPLCPGHCRMRHHAYDKKKDAHLYNCPAMRPNHKGEWIFHPEDCPFHENCRPETKMGRLLYLKSEADLRLFPPIPRDTTRFKTLYTERTSVERSNAVEDSYQLDRAHRNATFGLIRLCLVNICKHAKIRWLEATTRRTETQIVQETLAWLLQGDFEAPPPR
ncbi:MAG: hypothetical protein GY794_09500 [bacterium]|nr:hypothetical protein [bacterium]